MRPGRSTGETAGDCEEERQTAANRRDWWAAAPGTLGDVEAEIRSRFWREDEIVCNRRQFKNQ